MIRFIENEDAQQICDIYNYYVENTIITFEEDSVPLLDMQERIRKISASLPWLVYERNKKILGYAYASEWHNRRAYRFSVETTVYIQHDFIRNGIGTDLYMNLLNELKKKRIHVVIGTIAVPNEKSQRLHEKFGFKKVGYFAEVGYKFNKWIDVGYWELILP
jgi:phosphinothricin acetyltransferase